MRQPLGQALLRGALLALLFVTAAGVPGLASGPATAATGITERVSVASDGTQGNKSSTKNTSNVAISADGRYVAFTSGASNLVPGDTNALWDAFVHDREAGTTTRVSVASDGTQGDSETEGVNSTISISADGRFVAFYSSASNLVPGDTINTPDIFVHDRQSGTTTRVSVASDGTQGNGHSYNPSISSAGRYVTFSSYASNLVPNDTNGTWDVFVHDRQTGTTERVSVSSAGNQGTDPSSWSAISGDGRYVAFVSGGQIFVHDRQTDTTTRVSVANDGTQGNRVSGTPSINADGRYISFWSWASNLVAGDTNNNADVFVHDRQSGTTERVSLSSDGTQGNNISGDSAISPDGRFVTFASRASNLVSGDTNQRWDIFVHDRLAGITERASIASDGTQGNENSVEGPAISGDGRYVAFGTRASTLVLNDTNGAADVFVRDRGQAEPPPPPPDHKVLFIDGINSQSDCAAGGFAGEVAWMTDLFLGQTPGYEGANELIGIDSANDFLYYDYSSGSDATETCPDYERQDTCWSLDDYYKRYGVFNTSVDNFGQTRRLANYINTILADPSIELTLVGFSQGGILAAAAVDSYIGEPNLSRINAVVTIDSPLQGIADWAQIADLVVDVFKCSESWLDGGPMDSPWDMEDDSPFIRTMVNGPYPGVPLFTIDRVNTALGDALPVTDYMSRIAEWDGDEGHVRIGTSASLDPLSSHTWGPETVAFEGRDAARELNRLSNFLICALSPLTICRSVADLEAGNFVLLDRAVTFGQHPTTFSVGNTTQNFSVPADTAVLTVLVIGDPSYNVALVTPSAGIIDENTVGPDVTVQAADGWWLFSIESPEIGQWDVKSTAPDLNSLSILSVTTPSSTADQDADGMRDTSDNCGGLYNPGQTDTDADGLGNACDSDDDEDGVSDIGDNCPDLPNTAQTDTDGNGRGDVCDLGGYQDWDSDGVVDNDDNCPIDANADQLNTDEDYLGDTCDTNDDGDSCSDAQEFGNDETLGGLRDPLNPWDFYDVAGAGGAPPDGEVDLFIDILGVIQHYSLDGSPPYDAAYDRGPTTGPNPWNMTAPDGSIDLFVDILGVIQQYGHNCT